MCVAVNMLLHTTHPIYTPQLDTQPNICFNRFYRTGAQAVLRHVFLRRTLVHQIPSRLLRHFSLAPFCPSGNRTSNGHPLAEKRKPRLWEFAIKYMDRSSSLGVEIAFVWWGPTFVMLCFAAVAALVRLWGLAACGGKGGGGGEGAYNRRSLLKRCHHAHCK